MLQKREDYNDLTPTLSFTRKVLVLGGVTPFLLSPGLHKSGGVLGEGLSRPEAVKGCGHPVT